jgi:hypothetical protein
MVSISHKVAAERREQVWLLTLNGHNPQSIKKELNLTNPTFYRDHTLIHRMSKVETLAIALMCVYAGGTGYVCTRYTQHTRVKSGSLSTINTRIPDFDVLFQAVSSLGRCNI